jgi:hypothetical protein
MSVHKHHCKETSAIVACWLNCQAHCTCHCVC